MRFNPSVRFNSVRLNPYPEELDGDIPFLSTMMSSRRIGLVAHTLRAHVDGRPHSLLDGAQEDV